jgi:hypothetical protein
MYMFVEVDYRGFVPMTLFGSKVSEIESRLFDNIEKTKSVFPEEIQRIEFGLVLMRDLTQVTKEAVDDYRTRPNLFANHNLFARNRQLLLNAYICLLSSSYGTQFVILRTALENNNLMRLFNKEPQYAFEWLSKERQNQFSRRTQLEYGKSGEANKLFKPSWVRKQVFNEVENEKAGSGIEKFYGELSNYTHSNYRGWQELVGKRGGTEIILNIPRFLPSNADKATGIMLYLMQLSFKTFVETFKGYLGGFADQLEEWQENFNRLILRYKE